MSTFSICDIKNHLKTHRHFSLCREALKIITYLFYCFHFSSFIKRLGVLWPEYDQFMGKWPAMVVQTHVFLIWRLWRLKTLMTVCVYVYAWHINWWKFVCFFFHTRDVFDTFI